MTGTGEKVQATAVLPCSHVWVRKGLGTGTSEGTTLWLPPSCVLCGAQQSGRSAQALRSPDNLTPKEPD